VCSLFGLHLGGGLFHGSFLHLFSRSGEFRETRLSVLVIMAVVQLRFLRGSFVGLFFSIGVCDDLGAASLKTFDFALQCFHFLPRFLLRSFQLADPAFEQIVDHFQLADSRAQSVVVRGQRVEVLQRVEVVGSWGRKRVVGQSHRVEDVLRRNIGVLVLRWSTAAAERSARRYAAVLSLAVCLRVCQAAAHLRRVRQAMGCVCLGANVGVRDVWVRCWEARAGLGVVLGTVGEIAVAVVFARCLRCLDAIARFDHVGLERDRTRAAVEFEEEAAGVAEDGAGLIATPEGCCRGRAVLADRL
jgi:hypothetical protein